MEGTTVTQDRIQGFFKTWTYNNSAHAISRPQSRGNQQITQQR